MNGVILSKLPAFATLSGSYNYARARAVACAKTTVKAAELLRDVLS